MPNKPPRIYISAIDTGFTEVPRLDPQALELLAKLSDVGYIVYWEKQCRDYEIIERDIAGCDALLAIVDDVWLSSTWMASEVTWALGLGGARQTSNQRMAPIPVLLYTIDPLGIGAYLRSPFNLRNPSGPHFLESNIEAAVAQVGEILPLLSKSELATSGSVA